MADAAPQNISDLLIEEEMKQSYLTYAMSVIVSRALPDVRDGLKPSQRRILVAMNDLNLSPRAKYRKCAKVAGDTSGNYHPHGESVIYPTLVRMAQEFNIRHPLVDGQGNFGSIDGDPPAAMRYTESRLTAVAMELLEDLDKETVDLVPNYDETRTEPTVLPGKFPNLLCNGASGIAVGMATNIPPHNLGEVVDALIRKIEKPEAGYEELMQLMPGPDFPTGGFICGRKGIRDAYKTGRSLITLRARHDIEEHEKSGRKKIVFTEIPYQESKAVILTRIAHLVQEGKLNGVSDVRDESDRDGLRIVVELKKGEEETLALNQIFKHTNLQTTYSMIMIALVNGRPQTLSLPEMLQCYLDHRVEVIRRRTEYLLGRAKERAHILEGLKIALANIDEIVELIKKSESVDDARGKLRERFGLTTVQANAILAMQLQRLTGLEQEKLNQEYRELIEKIAEYESILASREKVLGLIRADLEELKTKHANGRRTEITEAIEQFSTEDLIADEEMVVTISHAGYIKRLPLTSYRSQSRGGVGISGMDVKEGDFLEHLFVASTHAYLLFFTDLGKVYWLKVYEIPQLGRTAKGRALVNLLQLKEGEQITSAMSVREFDKGFLVMGTERGVIKKSPLSAYGNPKRGGIIAIRLDEGDRLIGAHPLQAGQEVILATRDGYGIRFDESKIREQGRATRGVRGIDLRSGDRVVSLVILDADYQLLTVCEKGLGKRTPAGEYRITNRGGKGIINIKTTEKNGKVVRVLPVMENDEVMFVTAAGMVVRTKVFEIRETGRSAQGVRLVNLREDDYVVSAARLVREE